MPEVLPVPRVSVGMPVYNGERYLALALDSLLAQEYRDFELIISDNGSTDGTEAICRSYAAQDARIRYVRQPTNMGGAWNFSEVARLARGEYFRWACHDDLCAPSHLRRCVEVMDASPPSVVLVYTHTLRIDAAGVAVGESREGLDTRGLPPHARFRRVAERLRYANMLYGLMRRDALLSTDLIGPYESSDYVLLAQLCLLGTFAEVPEFLFYRRIHPGMSRKANLTPTAVAQWFSPSNSSRVYIPHVRLFKEYTSSVLHAPLALGERARTAIALWFWLRRGMRPLLKELAMALPRGNRAYR